MTIDALAAHIAAARSAGRRVVCASGYFNPLHVGHVRYLEAARSLGLMLVVIVNTDYQVGLKGSVPFMREYDRLEIVSSLRCVDAAVLAADHDRSVSRTLERLRPDVFANGGDVRTEQDCRELEVCRKLNIHIALGVGGHHKMRSSSELIRRAVSAP